MFIRPDLEGPFATVLLHQLQGKSLRTIFWTARGQVTPDPIGTELKSPKYRGTNIRVSKILVLGDVVE